MISGNATPLAARLVLAAIALVCILLLVIAQRVGATPPLVQWLGLMLFAGVVLLGGSLGATMRPSAFFIAGRRTGSFVGGLGIAAVMLLYAHAAASFRQDSLLNPGNLIVQAAVVAAPLVMAFGIGPALRRAGSFTLADFVRARFDNPIPHLFVLIVSACLLGLFCLETASYAMTTLVAFTGLTRGFASGFIVLIVVGGTCLGGRRSLDTCIALVGTFVIIMLLLPVAYGYFKTGQMPVAWATPNVALAELQARSARWLQPAVVNSVGVIKSQLNSMPPDNSATAPVAGFLASALAAATLLVSMGLHAPTGGTGKIIRSAMFSGILIIAIPVVAAATGYAALSGLDLALLNTRADSLPPTFTEGWLDDDVSVCGERPSRGDIGAICAGKAQSAGSIRSEASAYVLRPGDIAIQPSALGPGAAASLGLPAVLIIFNRLLPFLVAMMGLMLGIIALAGTLSHSFLYRLIQPASVTSSRLALSRLSIAIIAIAVCELAEGGGFASAALLQQSLAIGAATILPLLCLSLIGRAGGITASLAVFGGATVSLLLLQDADAVAEATLYGCAGAIVMACAGLASRASSDAERRFAKALSHDSEQPLILDRGA